MRASCAAEVAPIHAAPDGESEQVTQALSGEPLSVLEQRDGWARIETAYGYPGWIRETDLGPAFDDEWLPPPGGDPVEVARGYLGTTYLWGGMTERGIDCSGLVHMAFRRTGRLVPRDADQQEEAGTKISEADARPGDCITYGESDGSADHIAFWIGGGRILHAAGREDARRVVEEPEPVSLRARRRFVIRL